MAVIGINYDGCDHDYDEGGERIEIDPSDPSYLKYKSVYLHTRGGDFTFDSGDFPKDWYNAKKKYQDFIDEDPHFSHSSSVDHFIMDGGKFDSAYLHIVDEKPVFMYVNENDPHWFITQQDVFEKGWEFFVPENTQPTWEEFKAHCNA